MSAMLGTRYRETRLRGDIWKRCIFCRAPCSSWSRTLKSLINLRLAEVDMMSRLAAGEGESVDRKDGPGEEQIEKADLV